MGWLVNKAPTWARPSVFCLQPSAGRLACLPCACLSLLLPACPARPSPRPGAAPPLASSSSRVNGAAPLARSSPSAVQAKAKGGLVRENLAYSSWRDMGECIESKKFSYIVKIVIELRIHFPGCWLARPPPVALGSARLGLGSAWFCAGPCPASKGSSCRWGHCKRHTPLLPSLKAGVGGVR